MSGSNPTSQQTDIRPTLTHWDVLLCFALSVIAVVLRYSPLAPWSLWRDDAWQALVIRADSWTTVARIGQTAPGFSVLLSLWLMLTGFSSAAAQALPFLAGVAAAPLVYLLARRCGFGMAGAAAAGIALAIAPAHVNFSTRVKPFTLEADLSILLLFLAVRGLEEPHDLRRWLALLLAGVLGTIFSATALPITLAAALAVAGATLSTPPRRLWPAAAGLATLALFGLLWWAWWLAPTANERLKDVWEEYFIPVDQGILTAATALKAGTRRLLEGMSPLPPHIAGALIAIGAILLARRTLWLAALCVVPLMIAVAMAAMQLAPYGGGRTEIYLYPSMALLLGAPVVVINQLLPARAAVVGFVVAAVQLTAAHNARPYPAEDVRSIVGIIEAKARKQDAVIVYPQDGYIYGLYSRYPIRFFDSDLSMTGFTVAIDHPGVTTLILAPHSDYRLTQQYARGLRENSNAIRALFTRGHRPENVWFVARSDGKAIPSFTAILRQAGLTQMRAWRFPGTDLTLWTKQP